MNNRNKILCFILTLVLAVALGVGGGAILTVSDNIGRSDCPVSPYEDSGEAEGEEGTAEQTALPSYVSGSSTITYTTDSIGQAVFNAPYTGAQQTLTVPAGRYKLEVWGASGGGAAVSTFSSTAGTYPGNTANSTDQSYANSLGNTTWSALGSRGGAGGYAAGTINLTAQTTFYLYCGGAGIAGSGSPAGGFNGGGTGGTSSDGSGGGGTDVRIGGTTYYYRVIVAGGGGGADNPGGNRGPSAMSGSDDGSGGAGGGTEGERPFVDGVYSGSAATQSSGASFGTGATPTTSTDTGGGGGGWYGGYATNNNNGGAGGGSGYVLTASSYRPSGYAHGTASQYNLTDTVMHTGIWSGNGKIRITMLDHAPTNRGAAIGTVARTTTKTITPTTLAADEDSGDVLTFSPAKIYTDSACTTEATEFIEYTSASTSSITVHPKKYFTSRTFYATIRDKYNVPVTASFTMNAATFGAIQKADFGAKNGGNGIYGNSSLTGANYPDIAAIDSGPWSSIYNDAGTGVLTYMVTKPLETNGLAKWGGITSATVNVSDLATANDKWNSAFLDDVYITTYSATGSGYSVAASGSANKWTSLTLTPGVASKTGWYRVRVTIGLFEKATNAELTSASSGRLTVDIVFRVGNSRPTLNTSSSSVPAFVSLNTTTNTSATVTLADLVTDPNANDLRFYSGGSYTDVVKVPTQEYFAVDKFGSALASPYYNVGTASSDVIDSASSSTATGFEQTSIYNSSYMDASVHQRAYVSYTVNTTSATPSITFTSIRATRNQYAAGRKSDTAYDLGHFYVLVHITDTGDTRDGGLWYPIAVQVTDTRTPVVNNLTFEMNAAALEEGKSESDVAAADEVYISPYYLSTYPNKGIGALTAADYNKPDAYVDNAIARDNDEYSLSLGIDSNGVLTPFAFNDFIYLGSDFNTTSGSAYQTEFAAYDGFSNYVKAEQIDLYAPAAFFDRLSDQEKQRAGIEIVDSVVGIAKFKGIKLTAKTSTKENYVEIPVRVYDTFGHSADSISVTGGARRIISVKVANRENAVRDTINDIGVATRTEKDGVVTVTYTVPNGERAQFAITPYDLVYDPDLAQQPNVGGVMNSNPSNSGNTALANALYRNPNRVYASTMPNSVGTSTSLGYDTLKFVPSSLPFNITDESLVNGTASNQSVYTRELVMTFTRGARTSDGGTMDVFTVSPRVRNDGDNVYLLENVRVIDESGSIVTFNIAVRVINTKPALKTTNPVFYLTANVNSAFANNSQNKNGEDDEYFEQFVTDSNYATRFNTGAYNVREFTVREIVTDEDSTDLPSLEVVSQPKIGYVDASGVFHEANGLNGEPDYSGYVEVEYNVSGTAQRNGRSVIRIVGRNSTQALEHGLFIQIEVSDGFNNGDPNERAYLAFQVEVMNSRTVFIGASQFEQEDDGNGGEVNVWSTVPLNSADLNTPRYIAPDEKTANILINDGVNGIDGVGVKKIISEHIKYLSYDYDSLQTLMPHSANAELLPKAAYVGYRGDATVDDGSVAVWFGNPYASTDIDQINKTVQIVWFLSDATSYRVIDPAALDSATLAEHLKNDTLNWVIKISPQANFASAGLDIEINYRDSSVTGGHSRSYNVENPDGTIHTEFIPQAYRGVRSAANAVQIISSETRNFRLNIGSLGMVKNLVAYADPNNAAKDNLYAAYDDDNAVRYPSEERGVDPFYYTEIALRNDPDTGADTAEFIPLSYLALPNEIREDMALTVDFANSYNFRDSEGNPTRRGVTKQLNMLSNMTLYDPATGYTWNGADIANNPYFSIEYTDDSVPADSSLIANSGFVNRNLYYYDRVSGDMAIRLSATALREDLIGFKLAKKSVRSNGCLELTISLASYNYDAGTNDKGVNSSAATRTTDSLSGEDLIETVKLFIRVPNDNLQLLTGLNAATEANAANTTEVSSSSLGVEFSLYGQDAILSLVNDRAAEESLGIVAGVPSHRKAIYYDSSDYMVAPYNGTDRTFKETAYFLSASYGGNLTSAQIDRILLAGGGGGYKYGKDVTEQMLVDYFGTDDLAGVLSGSVKPDVNHGYTNFFTVSPTSRDDSSISFHPVARISIDEETALAAYNTYSGANVTPQSPVNDRRAAYEYYIGTVSALRGLKVETDGNDLRVYFPFRVIVYDDYASSGFMNGSYTVLTVKVLIANSKPYVNTAMVSSSASTYEYRLTIAKNESYTMKISDFFGDRNMRLDSSNVFQTKDDLKNNPLYLNTSDYFVVDTERDHNTVASNASTLKLVEASSNYADVAISFDGYYFRNDLVYGMDGNGNMLTIERIGGLNQGMNGQIRFYAVNRTVGNRPVEFTLTFTDGSSGAGSTVSVKFIITVGNQSPVALTGAGNTPYVTRTDITMKTGQVFTVLPTSWDRFVSGVAELNGADGFGFVDADKLGDDFYTTQINDVQRSMIESRYALSSNSPSAYRVFSDRSYNSAVSDAAIVRFNYSVDGKERRVTENGYGDHGPFRFDGTQGSYSYVDGNGVAHSDGNLGFLLLADDDLPWGLKFTGADPFGGVDRSNVLESRTLNHVGGYSMAYQFRALGSCTNVPLTFTVRDAEGKTMQFTFRITVENTAPEQLGAENKQGFDYSSTVGYSFTMSYGEKKTIAVTDLCSDVDVGDTLSTQKAYNGSAFVIDNVVGASSNAYFDIEDRTTEIVITCIGVYPNNKDTSVVRFNVVDALGKEPCAVTLNIGTAYSGVSDSATTPNVQVKSVGEYAEDSVPSEVSLVGTRGAVGCVTDADYGSAIPYRVELFATFDIYEAGIVEVSKNTATSAANADAYRLLVYNPATGQIEENTNAQAAAKLAKIKEHFDLSFSADGSRMYLTPVGATFDGVTLPMYASVTKLVDDADVSGKNVNAGVSLKASVGDSAPTAVGQNIANYGTFAGGVGSEVAPSANYLTVRGVAGYSQSYSIWNREVGDLGLFTDVDYADELTFVSARVLPTYVGDNGVVSTQDGWQATDTLPQAYSVTVENGVLTAKIVRKVVNTSDAGRYFTLPVCVTVKDKWGKTAETTITFEIYNSTPSFTEHTGYDYSVTSVIGASGEEEYLLEMSIESGKSATINLTDFLHDSDILSGGEKFTIVSDPLNEQLSLHDLDYSVNPTLDNVHKTGGTADEPMFEIRSLQSDNLRFGVKAVSSQRDATAEAVLVLRDTSLVSTPRILRMRFTVANSAPKATTKPRTLTLLGGESDDDEDINVYDGEITISIADYLKDPNPADNGGEGYEDSTTFMRVYTWVWGSVTTGGGTTVLPSDSTTLFSVREAVDDNELRQKIILTPRSGKYGTQTLTVYVIDDGIYGAEGALMAEFTLTVTVAQSPDAITLIDQSLPYMRSSVITVDKIMPSQSLLGYSIVGLRQPVSIDNPEGSVSVTETDGVFSIKANVRRETPVRMLAKLAVGDVVTELPFYVNISDNYAPSYRLDSAGTSIKAYNYDGAALDAEGIIMLAPTDWFSDPEGDDMIFLDVSSSRNFIVKAELDKTTNMIKIQFKARGSADISVLLTDATGTQYPLTVTVTNDTLPELNFFLGIAQEFTLRPWLYIGILIALIILILLIIFLAGVSRRKKREQAEVEALLVSEMQLEEQMRKIAASQTPPDAYLPPYQQPLNPNMLGGGMVPPSASALPPPVDGSALPPGGGNSGDGFDDGGL